MLRKMCMRMTRKKKMAASTTNSSELKRTKAPRTHGKGPAKLL